MAMIRERLRRLGTLAKVNVRNLMTTGHDQPNPF